MTAGGWQARALSWLLAIFATLAMVGAVATMSTNGGPARSGAEVDTDATRQVDSRTGAPVPRCYGAFAVPEVPRFGGAAVRVHGACDRTGAPGHRCTVAP